jgi:hypothetical protein
MALPSATCLGLHRTPLDIAIGGVFTQYCSGGHQGCRQITRKENYTILAGHFDGHGNALVLGTILHALPNGGGPGLCLKPLDATIGQVLAPIQAIRHAYAGCFFIFFHCQLVEKGSM